MANDTLPTLHNFDHLVRYAKHQTGLSQEDERNCLWSLCQFDKRYKDRPERQAFIDGRLSSEDYYLPLIALFRKDTGM